MPLTRQTAIDELDVYVLDGELPEEALKRLHRALAFEQRYTRSEAATAASLEIRHWVAELDLAEFEASEVGRRSAALVERHFPGEALRPFRVYCNFNTYGDALSIHRDCTPSERDVTALWFVCEQWERDWRGELLFFDACSDARAAVTPRPGRLCLFRGALPHAGTPPSRFCHQPRLTLACKFAPPATTTTPAASGFTSAAHLFEHIARRLATLPPREPGISYQFVVDGAGGGRWFVEWTAAGGRVSAEQREADLTLLLSAQTLLDVVNRRANVARAFVLGRIKATGNIALAIHLRELIGLPGAAGA